MEGRTGLVRKSRRSETPFGFWACYRLGIGCCGILTFVGVILLTTVFWPKAMTEFNEIEKCTDSIEVCVRSELCGEPDNQCTVGKLCSPCDDPDTADCEVRNKANGVACEDACYLTGTASCLTGECKGTCAGYCDVNSTCDESLILLSTETMAWVENNDTSRFWSCVNGVCTYAFGPINYNLMLWLHQSQTFSKMDDDYLKDFCLALLDQSQSNLKCIEASIIRFYPYGRTLVDEDNITYILPEYYTDYWCSYQYSCANQVLDAPPAPAPTPVISKRQEEGSEEQSKRQIPVASTSKPGGGSGGFGGGSIPTKKPFEKRQIPVASTSKPGGGSGGFGGGSIPTRKL